MDQYSVDKAEIIKGPASLSYGSDALAGVVNLIPTQAAPEGKMIGDITTEYQTNNKYIGGSAMLGATKNGWNGWPAYRIKRLPITRTNMMEGFSEQRLMNRYERICGPASQMGIFTY